MYMRPPAIPLLTIDPYFSVWAEESVLKNTVHWTGKPNTISGRVFVDGVEYHFLGYNEYTNQQGSKTPTMTVEEIQIDAYSTNITYSNEMIRLFVRFTSPLLVDDLYYVSRPVSYCKVSYESIDKHLHSVEVKFTVSEELVLSARGEGRALADTVNIPGMTAMKMGNGVQDILKHSGDEICIDWGYLYLAVVGHGKAYHTVLDGMYAMSMQAMLQDELLFLFAYDDIKSIQYFGENLNAYWKKDNKTIEEAMSEAAQEYGPLIARCNAFSEKINVLIGLMQLGTRCSDGSCEAAEDLISGFSAIEAEAELVQIGLKLCAAAVISAEQECFQVADGFVQPVQVARFILFRVQLHARQVLIASVAVAFDFCTCRNSFADDLLKCFARDVFHDLHPREQRSPVFRF